LITLALGLIHNRGNLGNRQQINNLLPLVVKHTEPVLDPDTGQPLLDPISGEPIEWYWYSLSGVSTPHEVKFYQIIPFGIANPNNLYSLNSYKVFYRAGDENKIGEHPRFFNWLLKRGTDHGADISLYLRSPALFGAVDLDTRLQLLQDRDIVLAEPLWGKVGTARLLRDVGQLREDRTFDDGIADLKARITARGLRYG
jgi:hypothetical protein